VLATQFCALRRRYALAAIAGLAGTLVRQDLIVWVGVAWLLALMDGIDPARWRGEWRSRLIAGFRRAWPLLLVMLLFAAFVLWNRGIAVGERERHALTFNPTNIACFLLCAWLVFLPQNVAALPRIRGLIFRPICIVLLVAGFALYMGTYANAHPYNGEQLRYFLHNEALHWLTAYAWIRAAAFVPMAWMVLTACVTDLAEPRLRVLYVIAPLAVGLHPLIEQRYFLPALTLFQVWREPLGARWENALFALYTLGTIVIMWGIVSERFFP
jgi:alpha-1,2-glucosyltransferase